MEVEIIQESGETGKIKKILDDDLKEAILDLIKEKVKVHVDLRRGYQYQDLLNISLMIDDVEFSKTDIDMHTLWSNLQYNN
jgi:predicted house-cleaning noncanonical NTP pyrophosphatase (MazG superfamily)